MYMDLKTLVIFKIVKYIKNSYYNIILASEYLYIDFISVCYLLQHLVVFIHTNIYCVELYT